MKIARRKSRSLRRLNVTSKDVGLDQGLGRDSKEERSDCDYVRKENPQDQVMSEWMCPV